MKCHFLPVLPSSWLNDCTKQPWIVCRLPKCNVVTWPAGVSDLLVHEADLFFNPRSFCQSTRWRRQQVLLLSGWCFPTVGLLNSSILATFSRSHDKRSLSLYFSKRSSRGDVWCSCALGKLTFVSTRNVLQEAEIMIINKCVSRTHHQFLLNRSSKLFHWSWTTLGQRSHSVGVLLMAVRLWTSSTRSCCKRTAGRSKHSTCEQETRMKRRSLDG